MSTPVVVTRHRCEHCRKTFASRVYANQHEVTCSRNPDERSCSTCRHFERQPCCAYASSECGCYGLNECKVNAFPPGEDWTRHCAEWEVAP